MLLMAKKQEKALPLRVLTAINSNTQLRIGSIILALMLLVILFTPLLVQQDPEALNGEMLLPPGTDGYLFGTDGMGRDMSGRILYGARTSIMIGLVSALISGVVGTLIGGVAGFFGGRFDQIISEITSVFLMIPTFFLILIIVAVFGSSMLNVMIVIGLTSWPSNARLMRVQALSLKERTFIKSVTAIGETRMQVLFRYIIPNGIFPVIANTTLSVAGAILTEAGLSFLGLGDPNVISWGQMIYHGKSFMASAWWVATLPGIATVLLVVCFYLIGDGLNVVLNPKLKSQE